MYFMHLSIKLTLLRSVQNTENNFKKVNFASLLTSKT